MTLFSSRRSSLRIGQVAPDFAAPDQEGTVRTLGEYRDSWLLLYFYPGDNTPGCTTQACSLRDHYQSLQPLLQVVGVSHDSAETHASFITQHRLPFSLLSDPSRKLALKYGVGGFFPKRVSFLIDPQGIIRAITAKRRATTHTREVMAEAEALIGTIFKAA